MSGKTLVWALRGPKVGKVQDFCKFSRFLIHCSETIRVRGMKPLWFQELVEALLLTYWAFPNVCPFVPKWAEFILNAI